MRGCASNQASSSRCSETFPGPRYLGDRVGAPCDAFRVTADELEDLFDRSQAAVGGLHLLVGEEMDAADLLGGARLEPLRVERDEARAPYPERRRLAFRAARQEINGLVGGLLAGGVECDGVGSRWQVRQVPEDLGHGST